MSHAGWCYIHYPTAVNNIPKEPNHYDNTMTNFAIIDNILAHSQRDIGESSNVAQICLSYGHTFNDRKYVDYAYILALIAQCSIDSSKRKFDVDITSEIKRIKEDIDIKTNGYPEFWKYIRKGFNESKINTDIRCPMNEVCRTRYGEFHSSTSTIPISDLFNGTINYTVTKESKKVRALINKYSLELNSERIEDSSYSETEHSDYLMALENYEEFIEDVRQVALGRKYRAVVLWLLKQTFCNRKVEDRYKGIIEKTRPLLMKTLYDVNKEDFLECFKMATNKGDGESNESAQKEETPQN